MPENWVRTTLGQLGSPTADPAFSTGPFGSAISSSHFVRDGVPVIRGTNLSFDVSVRLSEQSLVYVTHEKAKEFRRSVARRGDLVFTCWGTVGQVGLIDERATFDEYVVSNKQMKMTPNPEIVDSLFLYYAMSSSAMVEDVTRRAIGSSVPGFNLGQLKETQIDLPPLSDQCAIVEILGALDDKIESNRRLSRLAQEYARTELEYACWDARRVVQVGVLIRSVQDRNKSVDPDVRYVGLEHFSGFDLSLWKSGRAADTKSASKTCSQGDLLFGRIRPYFGNVCLAPGDAVVAQSVEVLRATQLEDREAAFLRLSSREFIDKATLLSSGTTMPQVKWHDLQKEEIVMPSDSKSVEFHKRVAPCFEVIARTPREVKTLTALRDALLPELLSGRLRVKDAETIVEGAV